MTQKDEIVIFDTDGSFAKKVADELGEKGLICRFFTRLEEAAAYIKNCSSRLGLLVIAEQEVTCKVGSSVLGQIDPFQKLPILILSARGSENKIEFDGNCLAILDKHSFRMQDLYRVIDGILVDATIDSFSPNKSYPW